MEKTDLKKTDLKKVAALFESAEHNIVRLKEELETLYEIQLTKSDLRNIERLIESSNYFTQLLIKEMKKLGRKDLLLLSLNELGEELRRMAE